MEGFSSAELLFFQGREAALPLYAAVRDRVLAVCPRARIDVKKTQISFFARYMFAAASFTPVGPARDRPRPFLTVSLCLPERLQGFRVAAAAEPYPGRWTIHILLGKPEDADGELTCWLRMAAAFAAQRGKRA
jgi:hypothetical protein